MAVKIIRNVVFKLLFLIGAFFIPGLFVLGSRRQIFSSFGSAGAHIKNQKNSDRLKKKSDEGGTGTKQRIDDRTRT